MERVSNVESTCLICGTIMDNIVNHNGELVGHHCDTCNHTVRVLNNGAAKEVFYYDGFTYAKYEHDICDMYLCNDLDITEDLYYYTLSEAKCSR